MSMKRMYKHFLASKLGGRSDREIDHKFGLCPSSIVMSVLIALLCLCKLCGQAAVRLFLTQIHL